MPPSTFPPQGPSTALYIVTKGLHFLLELCALAALAYWGFRAGDTLLVDLLLGAGAPLVAAAFWGVFRVPNDPRPAPVAIPQGLFIIR